MRIAIMTWYTYRNFGTALQASALFHVLKEQGHEVKLIYYTPTARSRFFPKISQEIVRTNLNAVIKPDDSYRIVVSEQREKLFDKYLSRRIIETKKCSTSAELQSLNEEFDAFICGSDGIWAPYLYDERYFLSFVEDGKKIISYAPSFGVKKILNDDLKILIKKELSRFTSLSVREEEGADIVKDITNGEKVADVVVDPTLLLSASEWDEFAGVNDTKQINSKYILCYFLNTIKTYWDFVQDISRRLSLPVRIIQFTDEKISDIDQIPFDVGPSEFVSLIKNATYVCTDSFHGLCFSIIYNRPFTVFKRFKDNDVRNINSRITHLIKKMGFEKYFVDPFKVSKECEQVSLHDGEFTKANQILAYEKTHAYSYLRHSLSESVMVRSNYIPSQICCGCGACLAVCERKAIKIVYDEEGFERCKVDEEICVKCRKCRDVCPMYKTDAISLRRARRVYAIKSEDRDVLKRSSSGGVGYELAAFLNSDGYYIAGCEYEKELRGARHILIPPMRTGEIPRIQGSKYIQSTSHKVMKELYNLNKDSKILFFGTPCQVSACDKILRMQGKREKAVLVELICHGVPTNYLWNAYLLQIGKENSVGDTPNVEFRNKNGGWRNLVIHVYGNENEYWNNENDDDFYSFFRRGLCDMSACYDCPYREASVADIRIGDYWGKRFEHDVTGVSMVIIMTECGEHIMRQLLLAHNIRATRTTIDDYWAVGNPYNPLKPVFRNNLIRELKEGKKQLHEIRNIYCKPFEDNEKLNYILNNLQVLLESLD